jgi:hypothetical protein
MAITTEPPRTELRWVDEAEAHALFDQQARALLGISGVEFLRRWDAGEYKQQADDPAHPAVGYLVALLPLAR